jgi:hypothetical protein
MFENKITEPGLALKVYSPEEFRIDWKLSNAQVSYESKHFTE